MKVRIRMRRNLYAAVQADLARPHRYAAERVGFLFGNGASPAEHLILIHSYSPVEDGDYVQDNRLGATIGSAAIRKALQFSLTHRCSIFHVHSHGRFGLPRFSGIDRDDQARLIPSFQAVCPQQTHGAMVLSATDAAATIWLPNEDSPRLGSDVSIVGWPLILTGGHDEDAE